MLVRRRYRYNRRAQGCGQRIRIMCCAARMQVTLESGRREQRGMAVQLASTPLPPNVHVVYEVLCSEGPQTGRQLERLLEKRGVVVPANRLLELPRRFPGVFLIDEAGRLAVPVACDRCGAHGCDTCHRDVGAQPCALC